MRIILYILFCLFLQVHCYAQIKVSFRAADDLEISADYFPCGNKNNRYVLMFHQAGSSRGEYREIAPKLKNLQYNCLAVDLRNGGQINFVKNETAEKARYLGKLNSYLEAKKDIEAAIDYAYEKTNKRVILMGSSYSASLCFLVAKGNPKVKGVIAFSPGDFFKPLVNLQSALSTYNVPTFVCCSSIELNFAKELFQNAPANQIQIYTPGNCAHGAKALWKESPNSDQIWLSLLMFFSKMKKDPFD